MYRMWLILLWKCALEKCWDVNTEINSFYLETKQQFVTSYTGYWLIAISLFTFDFHNYFPMKLGIGHILMNAWFLWNGLIIPEHPRKNPFLQNFATELYYFPVLKCPFVEKFENLCGMLIDLFHQKFSRQFCGLPPQIKVTCVTSPSKSVPPKLSPPYTLSWLLIFDRFQWQRHAMWRC